MVSIYLTAATSINARSSTTFDIPINFDRSKWSHPIWSCLLLIFASTEFLPVSIFSEVPLWLHLSVSFLQHSAVSPQPKHPADQCNFSSVVVSSTFTSATWNIVMTGFNLYISTENMKKNSALLWINVEKTVCECIYIYNFSSMIVSLTLTFGTSVYSSFLFYFFYVETGGKYNNREWNTWKSWTPL